MSSRAFRELCRGSLSPADGALLEFCVLDPSPAASYAEAPLKTPSEFLNRWRNWERALRLNLARYRAQRLRREGGGGNDLSTADPPDYPADAAAAAKTAAAMDSPLEAEIFLDKARWDAIELFQGIQYFSVNTIYAYLLKLLLGERRGLFRVEEGFAEYKGLYASIMEQSGVPK
jgi:hypothetical protein